MAKPFKLTPKQAAQQKRDLDVKDQLVLSTTKSMNAVLKDGIEQVYAHYLKTGKYKDPDLSEMDKVTEIFYKKIIAAAVNSCKAHTPIKRLAKLPEGDLPDGATALDRVLKNRRHFRAVMKRARALNGRAKKKYLEQLRKQFKKIMPLFETTDLSPREAKQKLAEAWKGTSARTTTIFRTEATRYFAQAQVNYFQDSEHIIGFMYDSVRDTSRTNWCRSRHGLIYKPNTKELEDNTPAIHWNCRSHLIPLVNDAENRKMLDDPRRDPSKVRVVPKPTGWKN